MALLSIEGIYKNGKIELLETPDGVEGARVFVTFLPISEEEQAESKRQRQEARERALTRMESGFDFGGQKFNRAEIYEERMQELEERRNKSR
jgi:hypothetical protein